MEEKISSFQHPAAPRHRRMKLAHPHSDGGRGRNQDSCLPLEMRPSQQKKQDPGGLFFQQCPLTCLLFARFHITVNLLLFNCCSMKSLQIRPMSDLCLKLGGCELWLCIFHLYVFVKPRRAPKKAGSSLYPRQGESLLRDSSVPSQEMLGEEHNGVGILMRMFSNKEAVCGVW